MKRIHDISLKVVSVVLSLLIIGLLAFVSSLYVLVLASADALKSLVEAEATIIGFFGIIAVYSLTSLDSRIDRLEQEKHEYEIPKKFAEAYYPAEEIHRLGFEVANLENRIEKIQDEKQKVANQSSVIGVLLVISLIANIGLLGFQSSYFEALIKLTYPFAQIVAICGGIPLMMFFESVWFIFLLLRRMGKKPETQP